MHEKTIALLDGTIEVLERDGWTKAYYGPPGSPHCVIGALRVAAAAGKRWDNEEVSIPEYRAAHAAIKAHLSAHLTPEQEEFLAPTKAMHCTCDLCVPADTPPGIAPETWNDSFATSQQEVIEMLNHCKFHLLQESRDELLARGIPARELQPA